MLNKTGPLAKDCVNLSTHIAKLPISIRSYNRLRAANLSTVEKIIRANPRTLMTMTGFGKKCLMEIASVLEQALTSLGHKEIPVFSTELRAWEPFFQHPEKISAFGISKLELVKCANMVQDAAPFDPNTSSLSALLTSYLPISHRAQNILSEAKIKNLDDLARTDPRKLLSSTNCGRKTIGELSTLMMDYFESIPASASVYYGQTHPEWQRQFDQCITPRPGPYGYVRGALNVSASASLTDMVDDFLMGCELRNEKILVSRMGLLAPGHRHTLEAVGREFHLTRERVRQITDKSIKRFAKAVRTRLPDTCLALLKYIRGRGVSTLDEMVQQAENLGSSDKYDCKNVIRMLLLAFPEEVWPLDPGNHLWSGSKLYTDFHTRVFHTAKKLLMGIPQKLDVLTLDVARSLHHLEDEQIENIKKILRTPSSVLRIEFHGQVEMVYPPHQNLQERRKTFIYNYMNEQGVPVQILELVLAMQDLGPELVPDSPTTRSAGNTIASLIGRDSRFAWAGPGTWGLTDWGYLTQEKSVSAVTLALLRSSGEPLLPAQIVASLSHLYRFKEGTIRLALRNGQDNIVKKDSSGRWYAIA